MSSLRQFASTTRRSKHRPLRSRPHELSTVPTLHPVTATISKPHSATQVERTSCAPTLHSVTATLGSPALTSKTRSSTHAEPTSALPTPSSLTTPKQDIILHNLRWVLIAIAVLAFLFLGVGLLFLYCRVRRFKRARTPASALREVDDERGEQVLQPPRAVTRLSYRGEEERPLSSCTPRGRLSDDSCTMHSPRTATSGTTLVGPRSPIWETAWAEEVMCKSSSVSRAPSVDEGGVLLSAAEMGRVTMDREVSRQSPARTSPCPSSKSTLSVADGSLAHEEVVADERKGDKG